MAGSVNKVIIVGNVGKDPELRSTQDGRRIANFSIATSETWRDKASGERKERTEWHRIVVFNDSLADIVEKYVHKGSKLYVEGALQTRKWTDQQGQERFSTEVVLQVFRGQIVLLGDSGNGNRAPPADSADDYGTSTPSYGARHDNPDAVRAAITGEPAGGKYHQDLDSEIPF